jgi:hypothetical protein
MSDEEEISKIEELKKQLDFFLATFDMRNKEDEMIATAVFNFIIRQLNADSLRGEINIEEYRILVLESVRSLFKLIFVETFETEGKTATQLDKEFLRRQVIFTSAKNFMLMLFSRVLYGRDREIIIKEIEARYALIRQQRVGE